MMKIKDVTKLYVIEKGPGKRGLLVPSKDVEDLDKVREYMPYLTRLMLRKNAYSISAPQVGINDNVMVTNVPGDIIRIYINPIMVILDPRQLEIEETCLSHPGHAYTKFRYRSVAIHATSLKDEQFILKTDEPYYKWGDSIMLSAVIQHEMDHLLGKDIRNLDDP